MAINLEKMCQMKRQVKGEIFTYKSRSLTEIRKKQQSKLSHLTSKNSLLQSIQHKNIRFCVLKNSKSDYTFESVSVSVRLHNNFWQNSPIVMKFSPEHYPICRSSSKIDLIRQRFTHFHRELPLFSLVFMEMLTRLVLVST